MAYAITRSCCNDASCVAVCPVNCIHPTPDEPDFATAEMLYIDPRSCIDCGACADACPVEAIAPVDLLVGATRGYAELNRRYFETAAPAGALVPDGFGDEDAGYAGGPGAATAVVEESVEETEAAEVGPQWTSRWDPPRFPAALTGAASGLRVAVVGSGPAASYAAAGLLTTSARVTMLERLPVAGGLVRFGVAPDHLDTRAIGARFATVLRNPRLRTMLGVEVGTDVTHDQLLAHHDAVVYAVGASADRRLGVPGEDLPGSLAARTVVGWYNAHPDVPADAVDLSRTASGRVVVIGTGNVALDVARLLLSDPDELVGTAIAPHALTALRRSAVREVVLVGRRGPEHAAYSLSELRPLLERADLDVVVDGGPGVRAAIAAAGPGSKAHALRDLPDAADRAPVDGRRRLVLRFETVIESVAGVDHVESVCLRPAAGGPPEPLPTDLVLRSVGYRSQPVPGLPFDEVTHTVPHRAGRVVDPASGEPVPGTYVVGWIKRGPSGGIGSNRADAAETVASIVADANAGRLTAGRGSARAFDRMMRQGGRRPVLSASRGRGRPG